MEIKVETIVVSTREEADEVLKRLSELISKYGNITVFNLYSLVGIRSNYTDDRHGWNGKDFASFKITQVQDGYLIEVPNPSIDWD